MSMKKKCATGRHKMGYDVVEKADGGAAVMFSSTDYRRLVKSNHRWLEGFLMSTLFIVPWRSFSVGNSLRWKKTCNCFDKPRCITWSYKGSNVHHKQGRVSWIKKCISGFQNTTCQKQGSAQVFLLRRCFFNSRSKDQSFLSGGGNLARARVLK